DVVAAFLSNGWNPTDKTLVRNVSKLLPTFRLKCRENLELKRHWEEEFDFQRKPFNDLEKSLDQYENLYRGGIENFLEQTPTRELGTLLSGGHDTSFALIEGTQAFGRPMHTFTATFPGWAFDEGSFAQNISNKFKASHHPVPFTPEDMDYMVSLIVANEEPVVGSSLPVHLCAMEAKNHVDNMLAGDGGDTLWGEYFPVAEYHKYVKNLPLWARKSLYRLSQTLRKGFDWERFWELEHVAKLFATENYYDNFLRKLCTYRHFSDEFQRELMDPEFYEGVQPARSSLELKFNKDNFSEMLIEGKLFNGFYPYQSFHTHRSMNHFGLDLYLPTINKEVMSFITSLPIGWVNGGTTFHRLTNSHSVNRRFHKKALSRYLKREEIYNRSFDIPWHNVLKPRRELLKKLKRRLVKRGWYRKDVLERMFDEFLNQKVKDYELLELKHH
ncbi:MAG: asparagine synthase-related protein, partial [Bacteriovoracaceae bacterium]